MNKTLLTAAALLAAAALQAANVTGNSRIEVRNIRINQNQELPGLIVPRGVAWAEMTPFTPGETVTVWLEGEKLPEITRFRCKQCMDRIADGYLEYFDGKNWKRGPELPKEITGRGTVRKTDVKFQPAVKARAIRLVILKTLDLDHENMKLADFVVEGKLADTKLRFRDVAAKTYVKKPFNTFDLPEKGVIHAEVVNQSKAVRTVHYTADFTTLFGQKTAIPGKEGSLTLKPGEKKFLTLECAAKEQGPYRLNFTVADEATGMVFDIRRIAFGMRDPKIFAKLEVNPLDKPGTPVKSWQERIREKGTIWGADVTQGMAGSGRVPGERIFRELKENGASEVYCALTYHDFEPMPGVYNFAYFDYIANVTKKYGLDVTFAVWIWDFGTVSQNFLKDEIMRDEKGRPGRGWSNCFSPYSKKFREYAHRAMSVFVKRYVNSPSVIGWHLHPYGMVDHDAHGIFDYHPDAVAAYREFLKKKYQTLGNVNKAYGTNYEAWDKITYPRPLWEKLLAEKKYTEMSRVLDTRKVWVDYLEFYHTGPLSLREEMMDIVRKYDKQRMICGMNASGGTGLADANYRALVPRDAFYGDQGLNGNEIIRRFTAKQRYKRPLRVEDISSVTLGRGGFRTKESLIARSHWDIFQACVLGLEHYNYVFPTLDDSTFLQLAFANPIAKKMVNEARESTFAERKIAMLHSYVTDVLEGMYKYQGIGLRRWWLMLGLSNAFYAPGSYFEIYTDEAPLDGFDDMKMVMDDGSRVLPEAMIGRIVRYVKNGGKFAMICGEAGERVPGSDEKHVLLKKLGYTAFGKMEKIHPDPAMLSFRKDNGILRNLTGMAVHNWYELEAPKGGSVVGYVGAVPAAVTWKFGKGEVLLIGGCPGASTEGYVQELFAKNQGKEAWILWNNAERELGSLCRALFADLAEWAKVPPLLNIQGSVSAILRIKNQDNGYLVDLYNHGPELTPVLRLDLPAGMRWKVTAITLTGGEKVLGRFRSEDLSAPGIALPKLAKDRMMLIRIEKNSLFGL